LSDAEIVRLAAFLHRSEHEFIQEYTRLRVDRRGLALLDKANGECVFLDGRRCVVQAVKPRQCREFPNLWSFPGAEEICRAIPRDVSAEEWKRRVQVESNGSE